MEKHGFVMLDVNLLSDFLWASYKKIVTMTLCQLLVEYVEACLVVYFQLFALRSESSIFNIF